MSAADVRYQNVVRLLSGPPVDLDTAAKGLSRGPGVYAWWAAPTVFPDLDGPVHDDDPALRLLYVGEGSSLRARILRTHLRRSGNSALRRTLAGLLMPTEHYRTIWTDRVELSPTDELRLTAWMRRHLRLTWAEDSRPQDIDAELVRRLRPPLNVHGVDPADVPESVAAAKHRFDTSVG